MVPMRSFLTAIAVSVVMTGSPAFAAAKKSSAPAAACRTQTYHDEVSVGSKCCFVDHFHYGTGDTQTSKEQAMASAGQAWSNFVNFEYGASYDRFSLASNKSFDCKGGGRQWSCTVEAIACQPN